MIEKILEVVDSLGVVWGASLYEQTAKTLARALNADVIIVGRINEHSASIRTVAYTLGGQIAPNIEYELKSTPCHDVMCNQVGIYRKEVQALFPEDEYLSEMQMEAYVGVPILDTQDVPVGIMVALFKRELAEDDHVQLCETAFKLLRSRFAAEFVRERQEKIIKAEVSLREGLIKSLNHEMRTPVSTLDHLAQSERELSKRLEWQLVRSMLRRTEVVMLVTQILTGNTEWQPRRFRASQWLDRIKKAPFFLDDTPIQIQLDEKSIRKILYCDLRILEHSCHLVFDGLIPYMEKASIDLEVKVEQELVELTFSIDKDLNVLFERELSNWKEILKQDFSHFLAPEHLEFHVVQAITEVFKGDFKINDLGERLEVKLKLPCNHVQDLSEQIHFRKRKILVVDDVSMNRKILNQTLIPLGAEILEASDGKAAYNIYKANIPDVILMDVQMPILDGFEASKAIRKYELEHNLSPCPIIAISANAERRECLSVGMNDHLSKPVRSDELSLAVYFMLEYST
jgi:CheY-like chemotaxis protein